MSLPPCAPSTATTEGCRARRTSRPRVRARAQPSPPRASAPSEPPSTPPGSSPLPPAARRCGHARRSSSRCALTPPHVVAGRASATGAGRRRPSLKRDCAARLWHLPDGRRRRARRAVGRGPQAAGTSCRSNGGRSPKECRYRTTKARLCGAFQCAQGDSNSHGPYGPQGPQPCREGVRGVRCSQTAAF